MQFAGSVSGHINREKSLLTSFISGWATERRRVIRHSRRSCCLRLAIEGPGLIIHTRRSLKQRNAPCRANSVKKVQDFQVLRHLVILSTCLIIRTAGLLQEQTSVLAHVLLLSQGRNPFCITAQKSDGLGLWLYGIEND